MYKQRFIITIAFLLSANTLLAERGIYLSATDYEHHQLSYPAGCSHHSNMRIHIDNFWGVKPVITIKDNGKKLKLRKTEIFGYMDCDGNSYRFYEGEKYQISEFEGFYIYTHTENTPQPKGFKQVDRYYISTTTDGELKPLNLSDPLLQKYLKQSAI